MPKLVHYPARFAFLRMAAFRIVLHQGVHGLTRRAIAAELGISEATVRRLLDPGASLACLAADEVLTRRRQGRWARTRDAGSDGAIDRALDGAIELVPVEESRVDEETVWLRLVLALASTRPQDDDQPSLQEQYAVADRGYAQATAALPVPVAASATAPAPGRTDGQGARDAFARHVELRSLAVAEVVDEILSVLGLGSERAAGLRAFLDGLTLSVCTEQVTPAQARVTLIDHLTLLPSRAPWPGAGTTGG